MITLKKTIFLLLFLLSCGDGESDHLTGKTFNGLSSQGGKVVVGCEGCGNPGSVSFKAGGYLLLQKPGDDQIFTQTYSLTENTIILSSGEKLFLSEGGESLTNEKGETFTLE